MQRRDRTVLRVALFMGAVAVAGAALLSDRYLLGYAVVPLLVALWLWWDSRGS